MKVGIIGSRKFINFSLLEDTLIKWQIDQGAISCIISGGADGTDKLSERFAEKYNVKKEIFLPNFSSKLYKAQPYLERNKKIVSESDCIIAFWDGKSKGTKHTLKEAKKQQKKVFLILI
jgi:predicted Rossmann fold nucleotide-binding protein DprA/Smf involved in DNA uptake